MTEGLDEIVITEQNLVKDIISDASKLQSRDEFQKDFSGALRDLHEEGIGIERGISRGTIYKIAEGLGVKREYVEQALQPLDLKRDVLKLSQKLGLGNSFGSFDYQRYRVNKELARILKKAKSFQFHKIYSAKEIESIFDKRGIRLNVSQLISEGLKISPIGDGNRCEGYYFSPVVDSKGNERYILYRHRVGW